MNCDHCGIPFKEMEELKIMELLDEKGQFQKEFYLHSGCAKELKKEFSEMFNGK